MHSELTILMPCLNEKSTLGNCIEQARSFLQRHGISGEVIIVDNSVSAAGKANIVGRFLLRPIQSYARAETAKSIIFQPTSLKPGRRWSHP